MEDGPPTLDYARSPRRRNPLWGAAIALSSLAAAVFSAGALVYGVVAIIYLIRNSRRADGRDIFVAVVINLIGLVSGWAAIRWFRAAKTPSE